MASNISDAALADLFLRVLREKEVLGHQKVLQATGVPRNTYYRMERGESKRLNFETRGRIEAWLKRVGAISDTGEVIGVDPVEELIRALSHPAVRGFLGSLSAQDRINAALAYADARGFDKEEKARLYRWAANEMAAQTADAMKARSTHSPTKHAGNER